MILSNALPSEMLALIAEQLSDDKRSLRALALTCSLLQDIAESVLYRDIFLTQGRECVHLIRSVKARSQRASAVHRVELRGLYRHEVGLHKFHKLLQMLTNIQELVYESPVANYRHWSGDGNWTMLQGPVMTLFDDIGQRSFLGTHRPAQLPLQTLKRLTLHWNGINSRYWSTDRIFLALFAHPQLEELTVSCAAILEPHGSKNPFHVPFKHTPLRTLTLIECNVHPDGLKDILSRPRALEHLYLGEDRDHHYDFEDLKNDRDLGSLSDPEVLLRALGQQSGSLRSFTFRPRIEVPVPDFSNLMPSQGSDFSAFELLERVTLLCQSKPLEELLTTSFTAPPNLKQLLISHNLDSDGITSDDLEMGAGITNRSRIFRLFQHTCTLKSIEQVTFQVQMLQNRFDESYAGGAENKFRAVVEASAKIGALRKKRLVMLAERRSRWGLIPPYLYGEAEPPISVVYDSSNGGWQPMSEDTLALEEEPEEMGFHLFE